MKRTRNLFVLTGKQPDVQVALKELQFKGTAILTEENISITSINDVFSNNKSVITNSLLLPQQNPINISIVNGNTSEKHGNFFIDISSDNIVSKFEEIAQKTNCDIGDHKSNSSGLNGVPTKDDCAYCRHIKNNMDDRCIYSSKYFFVLPTLGQFIKGYLLIIPYRHITSMAELTKEELNDFTQVIDDIKTILKLTYNCNNLLVWENGTGNNGIGKAKDSVVHAHLHVAPSNLGASSIERLSCFEFTEITTHELLNYGESSYLLLQDDNGWKINNNTNLYIPRQYIRQILAEEYGFTGEQWNWRKYPYRELMKETVEDISKCISYYREFLPDRIQINTADYLL